MQRFLYSDGSPLKNGKVYVTSEYTLDENGTGEIKIPDGQLSSVKVLDINGIKIFEIEGLNNPNASYGATISLKPLL
jgi:hypothetical protein